MALSLHSEGSVGPPANGKHTDGATEGSLLKDDPKIDLTEGSTTAFGQREASPAKEKLLQ